MIKCPRCGNILPSFALSCDECGMIITRTRESRETKESRETRETRNSRENKNSKQRTNLPDVSPDAKDSKAKAVDSPIIVMIIIHRTNLPKLKRKPKIPVVKQ